MRNGLRSKRVVIVAGTCTVDYEGRAASRLGEGDRILILKSDGSVLLHRPFGHEAVNWQAAGCRFEIDLSQDALLFKATRSKPVEGLGITFTKVFEVSVLDLSDEAEFVMHATEEDMKRAILSQPAIVEEGFRPIEDERPAGRSGFIDVFGVDAEGNFVIVETKRKTATTEDINQLSEYVNRIQEEMGQRPRAVIAAPSVQRSATQMMRRLGIEFRCVTPQQCRRILQRKSSLDRFS